jgi:hypothetical protein
VSLFSRKTLLVATHVAAFGIAFAATVFVMARSNDATRQFFALLQYFPQSKAASLSYEWGTQADAREMMSRYIAKAETQATSIDSIAQLDLDAAKVRLANAEWRQRSRPRSALQAGPLPMQPGAVCVASSRSQSEPLT